MEVDFATLMEYLERKRQLQMSSQEPPKKKRSARVCIKALTRMKKMYARSVGWYSAKFTAPTYNG